MKEIDIVNEIEPGTYSTLSSERRNAMRKLGKVTAQYSVHNVDLSILTEDLLHPVREKRSGKLEFVAANSPYKL